jgi:hypothetical protein
MQVKRVDKSSAVNAGDSSSWVLPAASIRIDKSNYTSAHRVIEFAPGTWTMSK